VRNAPGGTRDNRIKEVALEQGRGGKASSPPTIPFQWQEKLCPTPTKAVRQNEKLLSTRYKREKRKRGEGSGARGGEAKGKKSLV